MDNIYQFSGDLITWLQSLGGWLVGLMKFFSFLGTEEFYLIIAPAILWCWDAALGLQLGLSLMISASLNSIFKLVLHGPRPYWLDDRVAGLASETSFGVPSGHSQNAMVLWGTLAHRFRKATGWILAGIIIFLIGLSRLVLGVHFLHDVLVGWLLGALILWILIKIKQPVIKWINQHSITEQILAAFLISLGFILLGLFAKISAANFDMPVEWSEMAAKAYPDEPITPTSLAGLISNAGAFFGLAAGALWLEYKGGFRTQGLWWQLGLRYILGLVGVLIFWFGLGEVFPRGEEIGPFLLRYLRYALVGGWITGIAPYLFRMLKLAQGKN